MASIASVHTSVTCFIKAGDIVRIRVDLGSSFMCTRCFLNTLEVLVLLR